ncbi:MAG: hypothetical protein ACAH95_02470 [Fimbriimonas sp.]
MNMSRFTVTGVLVAACALSAAQELSHAASAEPLVQARDVFAKNGSEAIGRALTIEIPQDALGRKYFYSRLDATSGLTTVESWTDKSNLPIKAIYKAKTPGGFTTTTFEFLAGKVKITRVTPKSSSKAVVRVPDGMVAVMSQFNPHDYPGKQLLVFDPSFAQGVEHFVDVETTPDDPVIQYRVSSAVGWSEIETNEQGHFISMHNSIGLKMKVSELTTAEAMFARQIAGSAGK